VTMKLDPCITRAVDQAIQRYCLVPRGELVCVAVSGGKDSLLLALSLKELGIATLLVVVDMGYEYGWSKRVQRLLTEVGLEAQFVDVRSAVFNPSHQPIINSQLKMLVDEPLQANVTPCTACYNTKMFALNQAMQQQGSTIFALGHHQTDARSSLLKEALMTVDRWIEGHERYHRSNFTDLVQELRAEALEYQNSGTKGRLIQETERLVHDDEIDTDEPPRQKLEIPDASTTQIVRPLFFLNESAIAAEITHLGIQPEGSGCGHTATIHTQTPRELVQFALFRDGPYPRFDELVTRFVLAGVDQAGAAHIKSRFHRAKRLGPGYKPPLGGFEKL
jgi:hypothetical protein